MTESASSNSLMTNRLTVYTDVEQWQRDRTVRYRRQTSRKVNKEIIRKARLTASGRLLRGKEIEGHRISVKVRCGEAHRRCRHK